MWHTENRASALSLNVLQTSTKIRIYLYICHIYCEILERKHYEEEEEE